MIIAYLGVTAAVLAGVTSIDTAKDLGGLFLTPIVALTGIAVGFYFHNEGA
jgi:hypothetical protein